MFFVSDPKKARIISVIACTITALACGTNYDYSAWAPSFASRLELTATDSNLIGNLGNLGMYALGVPAGMVVDAKGPRWGIVLGLTLFALGYYPIAKVFEAGPGKYSVGLICLFYFLTGAASCSTCAGSIKIAAINFPESPGTATAFPVAGLGLSAMFFNGIAALLHGGTYNFLLLLAGGTVLLPLISISFMQILPPQTDHQLPPHDCQGLCSISCLQGQTRPSQGPKPQTPFRNDIPSISIESRNRAGTALDDVEESCPLLSKSSAENSEDRDIWGSGLLSHPQFWQLFFMLGLLSGIGLMTINVKALWKHYDPATTPAYIKERQAIQVTILSFCSFIGRLSGGIGSDLLVVQLDRSPFWCLFVSGLIFSTAQLFASLISDPHYLVLVSGLTGLAYGILFGVYPSLVAHCFGVHGLGQNYGTMAIATAIGGNLFNLLYGRIYDAHSIRDTTGSMTCIVGRQCYRSAYHVAFGAATLGVCCCLWSIRRDYLVHKGRDPDRARIA